MPMYEYQCGACGHRLEAIQKFSDKPLKSCPKCKKPKLERLLSKSSIQFKGSGWYITDYAKKSSPEVSKSDWGKSAEGKSDGGKSESDGGSKESKTETTKESSAKK